MKEFDKISSGNQVILSEKEMKNVIAGADPGMGCNTHGEASRTTCGGSCESWVEGPEGSITITGTCQIVPEVFNLCGCVAGGGGGLK